MDKLLILDIDETLLFATESPLDLEEDFSAQHYFVYKRPYLDEFLKFAFHYYKVAVWTSSNELYANHIVENIFSNPEQLEFVWARNRCVSKFNPETWEYDHIKDLKKVKKRGYPLEKIIMVDDTPRKLMRNYGNLVRVAPFKGDQCDKEFLDLMPYLERLSEVDNVRNIEKRAWKIRL